MRDHEIKRHIAEEKAFLKRNAINELLNCLCVSRWKSAGAADLLKGLIVGREMLADQPISLYTTSVDLFERFLGAHVDCEERGRCVLTDNAVDFAIAESIRLRNEAVAAISQNDDFTD